MARRRRQPFRVIDELGILGEPPDEETLRQRRIRDHRAMLEADKRAKAACYDDQRAEWPVERWMDALDEGRVASVIVEQRQGEPPRVSWTVRRRATS